MLCGAVMKMRQLEKSASHLAISTKYPFFTQRHGTGVALYTKRIGVVQNPQSTRGTLARGDQHVVWSSDEDEATGKVSISLGNFHEICFFNSSGGTKFMLLGSFTKHPSRSTADHISKSILCGRCGTVNYHPLLNI